MSNVIVTGYSEETTAGMYDGNYATVKYSPDGRELWVARWGQFNGDHPGPVITGFDGSIYITGSHIPEEINIKTIATIKYDSSGNLEWQNIYRGDGRYFNLGMSVCLDSNGDVLVTGQKMKNMKISDWVVLKLNNQSGVAAWTKILNGGGPMDLGIKVIAGPYGNLFVAGLLTGNNDWDFHTVCYHDPDAAGIPGDVDMSGDVSVTDLSIVLNTLAGNLTPGAPPCK